MQNINCSSNLVRFTRRQNKRETSSAVEAHTGVLIAQGLCLLIMCCLKRYGRVLEWGVVVSA